MRNTIKIILFSSIVLSGCSTTNGKNISCDFVGGSYESEQERRERDRKNGRNHESDDIDKVNGVLSAIFGAIGRSVTGSDKDECT